MRQVVWDDRYRIGVDFIDKEHKQLFSTMNKLLEIIEDAGKSEWACREGVKYLKNHSLEHFEHEEEYMKSIDYPEYKMHKYLHDNFRVKTLPALEAEMEEMHYSTDSIRHFLGVCIGWVVAHTLTEDFAISGKRNTKWIDAPHEDEREVLEWTIIQLIRDIFHLKAKLISERYIGQDFGNVICYRYIYRGQEDEKWEIVLVYEEELMVKIMSGILGTGYRKVDDMAINISRYISRQFLERVRICFPALDLFHLEKESLLTYQQLANSFEQVYPKCSLLFDTGSGYFAFCATSASPIQGKIAASINHQNAMDLVSQYLATEKAAWKERGQRKKILVVDDSDFMRSKLVKLFDSDYDVIEAGSSVAAIKAITLNKPDLVLLDYEMPVCDGRQTLEMIRSEKATANLPVIFLTGRGDVESVKKVMALRPEGYLLKSMPKEDIRKEVDNFFEKRK